MFSAPRLRPQPGPKPDTTLLLKTARQGPAIIHQPQQQQQQQLSYDNSSDAVKRPGMRTGQLPCPVTAGSRSAANGDGGAGQLGKTAGAGTRAGAWLLEAPSGRAKYGRDR
jgi:hypothetical protein